MSETDRDRSAEARPAEQGRDGDRGRRHVLDRIMLDPIMLDRVRRAGPSTALEIGCGGGLSSSFFDEPVATGHSAPDARKADRGRRVPLFLFMERIKRGRFHVS